MKSISFYTYSTFFSSGYKSDRFSNVLTNNLFLKNIKCLVGLPESYNIYFRNVKHRKFLLHKLLNKIPSSRYFNKRFFLEKAFDIFSSFYLFFDNSDIIFTSIRLNYTAFIAKKLGKIVILEGSEMHPLATLAILETEYDRINLYENNTYNNRNSINSFLKSIKSSDLIICFTKHSFDSFISFGVNSNNLVIINPGIKKYHNNIEPYYNSDLLSFVSTANHTLIKGTHKLLHAWSNINNKLNAELIIIGEVSKKIKEYIFINNLNLDNVFFIGSLNHSEIEKIYSNKNAIGILLSLSEGGPRSVLEYLSFGLPTIITKPCNFDLVQNNLNGYILDENCSVESVEEYLFKFSYDKDLYKKMKLYSSNLKKLDQDIYSTGLYKVIKNF